MTGQWRTFVAMLLVTVLAAGAAGWAGVRYGLHQSERSESLDAVLHRDLDLTADQDRQLETLEANFSVERARLQGEMQAANRDLARAITENRVYDQNAGVAIDRLHTAMRALQEETVRHVLAMRAVLTPAQTAVFDKTINHALGAEEP